MCGENPLVEGLRKLAESAVDGDAQKSLQLPLPCSSSSAQPKETLGTVTNGRGSGQDQDSESHLKHVGAERDLPPGVKRIKLNKLEKA